jgi:hypothetical protein
MITPDMVIFIQSKKDLKRWINLRYFKAEVENQHDKRIKIVRSDCGGSYTIGTLHLAKSLYLLQGSYRRLA